MSERRWISVEEVFEELENEETDRQADAVDVHRSNAKLPERYDPD